MSENYTAHCDQCGISQSQEDDDTGHPAYIPMHKIEGLLLCEECFEKDQAGELK